MSELQQEKREDRLLPKKPIDSSFDHADIGDEQLEALETPGEYIDDCVIHFGLEYFLRDKTVFPLHTHIEEVSIIHPALVQAIKANQDNQASEIVESNELKTKKLILLPVNNLDPKLAGGRGDHWSLLIYSSFDETWTHLDSLKLGHPLNNDGPSKEVVEVVYPLLSKKEGVIDAAVYNLYPEVPEQPKGSSDCGLYVIAFGRAVFKAYCQTRNAKLAVDFGGVSQWAAKGRKQLAQYIRGDRAAMILRAAVDIRCEEEYCKSLIAVTEGAKRGDRQDAHMLDYYKHQLDSLALMCQDQQYLAIDPPVERKLLNISTELPAQLVLRCMKDDRLPFDIRASFTRLMLHLHIVRGSRCTPVQYARLWRDIPEKTCVNSYNSACMESYVDGRNPGVDVFNEVLKFVDEYLECLVDAVSDSGRPVMVPAPNHLEQNKLTAEKMAMAQALAEYNYYRFSELPQLARHLLAVTDSTPMVKHLADNQADSHLPRKSLAALIRGMMVPLHSKLSKVLKTVRSGSLEQSAEDEVQCQAAYNDILKTELTAVEIIQFFMDVRQVSPITFALSWFKSHFPCDDTGLQLDRLAPDVSESKAQKLTGRVFEAVEDKVDFGGQRGKQLIRILIQMTMSDFARLTKVLFRHFAQYQELTEDLRHVQLLVSNQDVENYQQIARDLFILKNLTEKSELWVNEYQSKRSERALSNEDTGTDASRAIAAAVSGLEPLGLRSSHGFQNEAVGKIIASRGQTERFWTG